jgi:hypothetical protein
MIHSRQGRIALRKFVAVPVTVVVATVASLLMAFVMEVVILDTEIFYTYSLLLGLGLSMVLASAFKSLLKSRGQFKMDYIFIGMLAVVIVVSILSFLLNLLVFGVSYSGVALIFD